MRFDHIFTGSALSAVDAKGRLSVPASLRTVIERRSDEKVAVLAPHASLPCLVGYDRNYSVQLFDDIERARIAGEASGTDPAERERVTRAALGSFGNARDVPYDPSGRIILPPALRRRSQIEDYALFYAQGGNFEIWNPKLALQSKEPGLLMAVEDCLEEKGIAL